MSISCKICLIIMSMLYQLCFPVRGVLYYSQIKKKMICSDCHFISSSFAVPTLIIPEKNPLFKSLQLITMYINHLYF